MADEKPKLHYQVVQTKNPRTGGTLLRPMVTDRTVYTLPQVAKFALRNGYVRGQYEDVKGTFAGFIEAMRVLGETGITVKTDWFRISGELTGTVGANHRLTSSNTYNVSIWTLKDLRIGIDQFSWTDTSDRGSAPQFSSIFSPGASENGTIKKSKSFMVTGTKFNAGGTTYASNDSWLLSWPGEDDEPMSITLTPTYRNGTQVTFDWPSTLDAVAVGTTLTLTAQIHANGDEQATLVHEATIDAKLVA